jgi:GT2 family glycosyltransferase
VSSISPSLRPIRIHGKFLSRNGEKFLVKAMRLPGVGSALDLTEKLALRRRLDELAAANVTALILSDGQAETVLGVAGQAGLYAMVEITIDSRKLNSADEVRKALARVAQTVSVLRGYPALIGFLIDCSGDGRKIPPAALEALRRGLTALVRTIHESCDSPLIAFKRPVNALIAMGTTGPAAELSQELSITIGEDFSYIELSRIAPADFGPTVIALHRIAAARPLVIEFGEEFPGQEEVVAHAFGLGAAGVVAPATQPAASSGWQALRMLSAGELLPFAQVGGSPVLLPEVTPMVSVVVVTRDNESTIAACLESIGNMRYPNCEVIVADDGSRDRTAAIAATVAIGKPVRVVRGSRAGFGAACNEAMRVARGEFIAFTRADCAVDADWLAFAVRVIAEGNLEGCCGPIYLSHAAHATQAADGIVAHAIESSASSISARPFSANPISSGTANDREMLLSDCNMIVRKSSLAAVGGFDPRFTDGGGDADLSARMIDAGMALGWCPAGMVWRGPSAGVGEFYRERLGRGRAAAMLASKHPGRFGVASRRMSPKPAGDYRDWMARVDDGIRDGIASRGLSLIFSSTGTIVEFIAHRLSRISADRVATPARPSTNQEYDLTHRLPIANSHAHSAAHH